MSNSPEDEAPSRDAARYIAEKGEAAIAEMLALLKLAKEMLENGEVEPPADGHDPHYPPYAWELTELPPGSSSRIWLGTVDDFATGEGLTVYFAAALAGDADHFRRIVSRKFGRHLANHAEVREGYGPFPFSSLFMADSLRSTLEAFDKPGDRPAAMSYFATYHANYS